MPPQPIRVKPALGGYRKKRGSLVPPMLYHFDMQNVDWRYEILPEIVWLGLLVKRLGYKTAIQVSASLAASTAATCRWQKSRMLAFCSAYGGVSATERRMVLKQLRDKRVLQKLRIALEPLVLLYPTCPLKFVFPVRSRPQLTSEARLAALRAVLSECLFRRERLPTLAQGAAVACLLASGQLRTTDGVSHFHPEVLRDYPKSEEAKAEAAGVRAALSGISHEMADSAWCEEFWTRGLKLAPCTTAKPTGLHYWQLSQAAEMDWVLSCQQYFMDLQRLVAHEFERRRVTAYKPLREQVVSGLVARATRAAIQLFGYPLNWTLDTSEMMLRVVADLYVTARWLMERASASDFLNFESYAAGNDVLYAEHLRVALERRGAGPDTVKRTVDAVMKTGVGRHPDLTAVNYGHWAKKDARLMCRELDCEDLYHHVLAPASWSMHGMYSSLLHHNLALCREPLHGLHRLPIFGHKPPLSDWNARQAVMLIDDLLPRWIKWRGGVPPSPGRLPGYRLIRFANTLARQRRKSASTAGPGATEESSAPAALPDVAAYQVKAFVAGQLEAGRKNVRIPKLLVSFAGEEVLLDLRKACADRGAKLSVS